jgi:hypothetical protein
MPLVLARGRLFQEDDGVTFLSVAARKRLGR